MAAITKTAKTMVTIRLRLSRFSYSKKSDWVPISTSRVSSTGDVLATVTVALGCASWGAVLAVVVVAPVAAVSTPAVAARSGF